MKIFGKGLFCNNKCFKLFMKIKSYGRILYFFALVTSNIYCLNEIFFKHKCDI
jgi:hypothetical protein